MPDPSVRVHPRSFDCDLRVYRVAGGVTAKAQAAGAPEDLGPPALIIKSERRTGLDRFLHRMGVLRPFLGVGVRTPSEADLLHHLEASFSPEHMGTYLEAAQGDRTKALQLYRWNTAVSAALYAPLQGLELALRHAMHRELAARYGNNWYDNPAAGLDFLSRERIATAKRAAAHGGHGVAPPRVVEKLCFGFWTSLLSAGGRIDRSSAHKADYARTLWAPALRGAFAHRTFLTRRQAQRALDRLRRLRNKVAHYEPIFMRPLRNDHQLILDVTAWISPEARAWIEQNSRVPQLVRGALT